MALVLYGGYYDKEKALEILSNLKYYSRDLEPISEPEGMTAGMGIIAYMKSQEGRMHEDYIIERLKRVEDVLKKQGDEAIDKYCELTEQADKEHPLFNQIGMMGRILNDTGFAGILNELLIPMKKDEFEHYLDIYNKFRNETNR